MILDAGKSIKTFEELEEGRKKEFIDAFVDRRRTGLVCVARPEDLPTAYCAVITEPDLGDYDVKFILPFKFADPYAFEREMVKLPLSEY